MGVSSPMVLIHTNRPSGASTRSYSAANMNMFTSTITSSDPAANGSAPASARTNGAKLRSARASILGDKSKAAATGRRAAMRSVAAPVPQPISTRQPGGRSPRSSASSQRCQPQVAAVVRVPADAQLVEDAGHERRPLRRPAVTATDLLGDGSHRMVRTESRRLHHVRRRVDPRDRARHLSAGR